MFGSSPEKGEAISALEKARERGWARYLGYSGDGRPARFAVECDAFDALQTSINIADQEAISQIVPLARTRNIGLIAKRPLGSGISDHERDAVLRRFYRSDKIRHTSGFGLGLNLVTAIVKLHGFRFTIFPGSGCVVEIGCPQEIPGAEHTVQPERSSGHTGSGVSMALLSQS